MIDTELFKAEYARAKGKYTDELWQGLHPRDMLVALQREVDELAIALWCKDLNGKHGTIRECCHVLIVAARIAEEMRRRGEG